MVAWNCSQTSEKAYNVYVYEQSPKSHSRHSCVSQPLRVDIFPQANTADETNGCDRAQQKIGV